MHHLVFNTHNLSLIPGFLIIMPTALQLEPSFFLAKLTICCVSSYPADFLQLFYFTDLPISDLRLTGGANRLALPARISRVCALSACFASDQRVPHEQTEILCASQHDHGASCSEYIDFCHRLNTNANQDTGRTQHPPVFFHLKLKEIINRYR